MTPPILSAFNAQSPGAASSSTGKSSFDLFAALHAYSAGLLSEDVRRAGSTMDPSALLKILPNLVAFFPRASRMGLTGNKNLFWGNEMAEASARSQFETRKAAIESLSFQLALGGTSERHLPLRTALESALNQLPAKTQKILIEELGVRQLHGLFAEPNAQARIEKMIAFAEQDRPHFLGYGSGNTHQGWFQDKWNLSGHRYNPYFARTLLYYVAGKASTGSAALNQDIMAKTHSLLAESKGSGIMAGINNLLARGITLALCTPVNLVTQGRYGKTETCVTPHRKWSDEDMQDIVGRGLLSVLSVVGYQKFLKGLAPRMPVVGNQVRFERINILKHSLNLVFKNKINRALLPISAVAMTDSIFSERFISEEHRLEQLDEKAEFERYPNPQP